jgi:hypothetical protein
MKKMIKVLIIGGSGMWSEKNHYPALLDLKNSNTRVTVVAICDFIDPSKIEDREKRTNLKKILSLDSPQWINLNGKSDFEIKNELNILHTKHQISAVVIASNPSSHFFYCKWALEHNINILCDKPIVTVMQSPYDCVKARLIQKQFDKLITLYKVNITKNPNYIFCIPLRRRFLTPFVKIHDSLKSVYKKTGVGVRYMNVIINGGIHKYPQEYTKGGAHGHLEGVGTLSHSSYHYIDVIAWFIQSARGNIKTIELSLPYVLRVKEYIKTKTFTELRNLIEGNIKQFDDKIKLSSDVLNSELDFSVYLKLKDKDNNQVGLITFIVNYSGFAPRLTKYYSGVTEYAHDHKSGRMSSVYFDIHQGALQQWQLIKNDNVNIGHTIELRRNIHPKLGNSKEKRYIYQDAYKKDTLTTKDSFKTFIKLCGGASVNKRHLSSLTSITEQGLSNSLYSAMYNVIAKDFFINNSKKLITTKPIIIDVDKYIAGN